MKKLIGLLIALLALNACANSLAFLGPASTSITGGNVAQSAFSSAASYGVKKQTGKTPSQHALAYVQKHNPENKKEKCIEFIDATNTKTCAAVKENLSETRKKIVKIKNSILDKSKIENLAKQSDLIKR